MSNFYQRNSEILLKNTICNEVGCCKNEIHPLDLHQGLTLDWDLQHS